MPANEAVTVTTVQELITVVEEGILSWNTTARPWFRGEPGAVPNPLLPKLFRTKHDELLLLKNFRIKAPTYVDIQIPQKGHTDQWIFLAQHIGLATRLLDWTEGLLTALHFAVNSKEDGAVVWMLNPHMLNQLSQDDPIRENDFPITWFAPELDPSSWIRALLAPDDRAKGTPANYRAHLDQMLEAGAVKYTIGSRNIRAAWEANPSLATRLPVALHPTAIHPRITVQKSALSIWGNDNSGLSQMVDSKVLRKFVIEDGAKESVAATVRTLGTTWATLFPDLDHLAQDLNGSF